MSQLGRVCRYRYRGKPAAVEADTDRRPGILFDVDGTARPYLTGAFRASLWRCLTTGRPGPEAGPDNYITRVRGGSPVRIRR
jgi:hypothetical protein